MKSSMLVTNVRVKNGDNDKNIISKLLYFGKFYPKISSKIFIVTNIRDFSATIIMSPTSLLSTSR